MDLTIIMNNLEYVIAIILVIYIASYFFQANKEDLVIDESIPRFVNYNASWCYYSRELEETWSRLTEAYKDLPIQIINYKCDTQEHEEKCKLNEIYSYPTLRLYNGSEMIEYSGDRTFQDLSKFINDNVNS